MRAHSNWQWHLDALFVKINGETHYLWRAVDHEGEGGVHELDLSRDCDEWDLKPQVSIIKSIAYVAEKVRRQTHPLRHPNALEIQP
jgi:hypothetical protein